jgi:rubrerythrin
LHSASGRAVSLPEGEAHLEIKTKTEEDQQMDPKQVEELLYQALETELGGVQVYKTAIRCAENEELKEEWEK